MGNWTPGPWRFLRHEDGRGEEIFGFDVAAENGKSILYFDADDNPETEANARLIASAPELLEALKGLLEIRSGRTVKAARAAILKAEGKS